MHFQINQIPENELPYYHDALVSTGPDSIYRDGIPIFTYYWMDGKQYLHPTLMTQKALDMLSNFRVTNDTTYLHHAELIADKLIKMSITTEEDSSWLFMYPFTFYLHDLKDQALTPPWVSGMAQGQALSLFTRLFKFTGKNKYGIGADRIFRTFYRLKGMSQKWVTMVDCDSNLWIEEYPMDIPCHALNGYIFAVYGLYDYYRMSGSVKCKKLLLGCLTTIYKKALAFRVPKEVSYYCLKHRHQDISYHNIHVHQFRKLYEITGNGRFLYMSVLFAQDFKEIN